MPSSGVQFCAVIDRHIEQLNNISGGRVEGLILRATYSSNSGFSFGILMPAPVTVSTLLLVISVRNQH
jgi:hypothetical protein